MSYIIDVTTPDGYDIATALRGPDFLGVHLKDIFTARIRAACRMHSDTITLAVVRTQPVGEITIQAALVEAHAAVYVDRAHFLTHTRTACQHLGLPKLGRLADKLIRDPYQVSVEQGLALANGDPYGDPCCEEDQHGQ